VKRSTLAGAAIAGAGAAALLGLALWSAKRHKDPHLELDSDAPIDELLPSLCGLSLGMPIEGNAVEIVQDAAFFDALEADVAAARRSVHFETFLWKEGALGARLVEALCAAAARGCEVRLVLDAVGCRKMGAGAQRRLREAGCELAWYHPAGLRHVGMMAERDHRKIAVLDGRVAWIGGHCVCDEWLKLRDLSVRLRGPVVHAVQSVFSENWVETTGRLFAGDAVFPPPARAGEVLAHVASIKPEGSAPAVKILHHAAICIARRRLWIQNPYFIPEPDAVHALAGAVRRGVDVRIMTPAARASDMPMVQRAGQRNFRELLDAGVRLFEYQRSLLHQKVMTVDGAWCAVGSSNFDDRSFETNDEITLGFLDAGLARRLEEIFAADMRHCRELDARSWRRRSIVKRARDSALYLFNEVL
jgi:cardiolipin synthase